VSSCTMGVGVGVVLYIVYMYVLYMFHAFTK